MGIKDMYTQPARKPDTNAVNEAGGVAYENSPEWQLTKLVTTGMLSNTYYVDAKTVNDKTFELAKKVSPEFLAKLIVYARNQGYMRSNPIQLLVLLSVRNPYLFRKVFRKVVHTGKDLIDFVTVVLSGSIRKELGSAPRKEVREMLNKMDAYQYVKYGSNQQNPSIKDIIKIAHPEAPDNERNELYKYMLGKEHNVKSLPVKVQEYLEFVASEAGSPNRIELLNTGHLPHEVVTATKLTAKEWTALAQNMPYMATLRNLNTMARQGVFEDKEALRSVTAYIANEEAVTKSKQFPYRFMSAYLNLAEGMPQSVKTALGKAMEVACRNIPSVDGLVVVGADTSGSMSYGHVGGSNGRQSKIRFIDVAALISSAILKKNPDALILPFDTQIHKSNLNADDTILTNAQKLAKYGGGGTCCSLPFEHVLHDAKVLKEMKLFIGITDSESWVRTGYNYGSNRSTDTMAAWKEIRRKNPQAEAILINVAPYTSDQVKEGTPGLTMVSGFSDEVFRLIGMQVSGGVGSQLDAIKATSLEGKATAPEVTVVSD